MDEFPTPIPSDMITSLSLQVGNYPAIQELSDKLSNNSSTVFIAQSLSMIEGELIRSPGLITEALQYLDLLGIYSLMIDGSSNLLFDKMVEVIVSNRVYPKDIHYEDIALSKEAMDDFLFSSEGELVAFLRVNRYLVAIYTYMLIASVFMQDLEEE